MNHVVLILYFSKSLSNRGTPTSPAYRPCHCVGDETQWPTSVAAYSGNVQRRILAPIGAKPSSRSESHLTLYVAAAHHPATASTSTPKPIKTLRGGIVQFQRQGGSVSSVCERRVLQAR